MDDFWYRFFFAFSFLLALSALIIGAVKFFNEGADAGVGYVALGMAWLALLIVVEEVDKRKRGQ